MRRNGSSSPRPGYPATSGWRGTCDPTSCTPPFSSTSCARPGAQSVLRTVVDDAINVAATVGAPPTWVLSNHDVTRTVTRYSRSQPDHLIETDWERARWAEEPADYALGLRRARAAALMQLALPGTAYVYQGEELGLEEVEDLPDEVRQDPIWEQSGHADVGRDGCRVPLPWSGDVAPFGFSPNADAQTWLPQPARWASRTVEAQDHDPESTLNLYREALSARSTVWVGSGDLEWIATAPEVAAFRRGRSQCWVNTGAVPVDLPAGATVVLASVPGTARQLPPDATAWLQTSTS